MGESIAVKGRKTAISLIGYFLLATMYCTSITYGILSLTVVHYNLLQIGAFSLLSLVIWSIIAHNKYTILSTIALIIIAAFLLFLYYIYGETSYEFFDAIYDHIYYLKEFIYTKKADELYHLIFVIGLSFVTALYATITMRKLFCFPALIIPGMAVFLADLFFKKLNSPIVYLGFVLSLAILFAIRTESKWKLRKTQKNIFGKYAFSVLPICLVAVILASFASSSFSDEAFITKTKLSEQSVNNINQVRELLFPQTNNSEQFSLFDFKTTGFNPNSSRLGGDISPDTTEVLKVNIDSTTDKDLKLYLKGAAKDVYTGTTWNNSDDTFKPLVEEETDYFYYIPTPYFGLEMNILQNAYSDAYEKDEHYYYYENVTGITIRPLISPINTVFHSLDSNDIQTGIMKKYEANSNGDIRVSPAIEVGYSYYFTYSKSNYIDYEDCYNQAYRGYFKDHEDEVKREYKYEYGYDDMYGFVDKATEIGEDGVEDFYTYLDEFYEKYTALPDSLPERVGELAHSITENAETDYEKLKALEDYLREIPYTMSPGSVPSGRDFVDYFLFDSKEGYCTYYASAMCVMARALGFPSRYVQGYVTPENGSILNSYEADTMTIEDDSGEVITIPMPASYRIEYTVTNAQAHAWAEIYLEGIGWVQFEPTAPYASLYYDDDKGFIASADMEDNEEFNEHINAIGAQEEKIQFKPFEVIDNENLSKAALVMLGAILFIMLLIAIIIIFRYRAKQKHLVKLRHMDNISSAIGYYNEIAKLLRIDGNEKYPYETPIQFAERISGAYSDTIDLEESASLYSKAFYGNNALTLDDRSKLSKQFSHLNQYMKNKLGKIKYTFGYWLKK